MLIIFCLLFSICKVSTGESNPDLNKKGMGKKEAKEANEMLFLITHYRRKLCVTPQQNTSR